LISVFQIGFWTPAARRMLRVVASSVIDASGFWLATG
jgi:hypothetical protein